MHYIFWSFHNYNRISTALCGKTTFLQKNINMQCCRTFASERKLGEYFFPDTFKSGFKRVFGTFQRGFQHVPHSKGFQSVSKGFPKDFKRVSEVFQSVFKAFSKGFQAFPKGFKAFPKCFKRVSKHFQRVSKGFQTLWNWVSKRVSERPQTP